MTKLLGSASELLTAEVISKNRKKGHCLPSAEYDQSAGVMGADLQMKIRPLRLQFMGAGQYGCSYASGISQPHSTNPLLKYTSVCGPPDLRAVARRLRTSGLALVSLLAVVG